MSITEYKIPPKEYKKFIESIQLQDIYLESCSTKMNKKNIVSPQNISISSNASYTNNENNITEVRNKYTLVGYKSRKRDFGFKIVAEYVIDYKTDIEFSDDFFEIFKELNVPLNLWPYFREFVQNMMSRMNLPPLTLPLNK